MDKHIRPALHADASEFEHICAVCYLEGGQGVLLDDEYSRSLGPYLLQRVKYVPDYERSICCSPPDKVPARCRSRSSSLGKSWSARFMFLSISALLRMQ